MIETTGLELQRRRILACAFACSPPGDSGLGGGEDILGWNLVFQIAKRHKVWALTHPDNKAAIEQELSDNPNSNLNFCYVGLPTWLRPMIKIQGGIQAYYFLWQIRSYFSAKNLHRQLGFDLFHHITYANDWMASFIGALLPVPYVRGPGGGAHRTPRGFEREYPLGGCIWEKIRSLGQWIFRHDPIFMKGHHRASAILACNQEALDQASSKWPDKVKFFPVNGITSSDLATAALPASKHSEFRVLTAGTLIRVKGFGLAIKAFKKFGATHPDAIFDIVGSGPELPRLKKIAKSLDPQGQIRFKPRMERGRLLAEMAASDVFLFPSLRDGGGAVVIEAMAAGTPVVCLNAGGPAVHTTAECGIKIDPDNPDNAVVHLAEALERLYQDPGLKETLGQAARARAEEVYHWDRLGERLMGIYEDTFDQANTRVEAGHSS